MNRSERLQHWLRECFPDQDFTLAPASVDASFRSYFRITLAEGSYIAMDAPPEHEDCRPYLKVARLFREAGGNTPSILAENLAEGFLLLSDLGDTTYQKALLEGDPHALYRDATAALVAIQSASKPGILPDYDETLLMREISLFPEWYVERHLGYAMSDDERNVLAGIFATVLASNLAEPRVYVHRDYHCRNLMVSDPNPGILDFQDAVYGPISYDLVSLFKDAYIAWDEEYVLDWLIRYWERARKAGLPVTTDFAAFHQDFEWMGVQRHLKILGIFARLYHRDGKDGYLKDLPLVRSYLMDTCRRYRPLNPLAAFLDRLEGVVPEAVYSF